jgi:hypothetical protein
MKDIVNQPIEARIYFIRGQRVMLDADLARLYDVATRVLNQAVRRNVERFPTDFMFQLNQQELDIWKSQIVISNRERMGLRKKPLAFTEQGVAMLSSVLRSRTAIQVNIAIMRAFVKVRHALGVQKDLAVKVERLEGKVNLIETDVRFLREDMGKFKNPAEKTGPQIKGFSKD